MFTGLVEAVGRVARVSATGSIVSLQIEAPFSRELKNGQSVCVSGVCLTVISFNDASFKVEMMAETVKRTKFSDVLNKGAGAEVNLERALCAGDRFDGHFVLGHIDGVGFVRRLNDGGAGLYIMEVEAPPEISLQIVSKGSVAIDGVSLTVIDNSKDCFSVGLIPTTQLNCTLGKIKTGDKLNIETDIIGKYILAKLSNLRNTVHANINNKNNISLEKLIEMGW